MEGFSVNRLVSGVLSAALIASGIIFGSGGPAFAASCSGGGCVGHDPYLYGCAVTSTTSATYTSGAAQATIVNKYSFGCNANWAEASLNAAARSAGWQIQESVWDYNAAQTGTLAEACFPSNFNNSGQSWETCNGLYYNGSTGWPAWTDMVNGSYFTKAPMSVFNASGTFLGQVWANQ
jgi:hypothetical protein